MRVNLVRNHFSTLLDITYLPESFKLKSGWAVVRNQNDFMQTIRAHANVFYRRGRIRLSMIIQRMNRFVMVNSYYIIFVLAFMMAIIIIILFVIIGYVQSSMDVKSK